MLTGALPPRGRGRAGLVRCKGAAVVVVRIRLPDKEPRAHEGERATDLSDERAAAVPWTPIEGSDGRPRPW